MGWLFLIMARLSEINYALNGERYEKWGIVGFPLLAFFCFVIELIRGVVAG